MRYLAVTIPELGHIHPMLPTLRRLRAHDVVLASPRALDAHLRADDTHLRALPLPEGAPDPTTTSTPSLPTRGAAFAARLRDGPWLAGWIRHLLIEAAPRWQAQVAALLRAEHFDGVITDPMLYGVVAAAMQADVPWVGLSSSLNPVTPTSWTTALTETIADLAPARRAFFTDQGLSPPAFRVADALGPRGTVCFGAAPMVHDTDLPIDAGPVWTVGAPFHDDDLIHPPAGLDDKDRALLGRLRTQPPARRACVYASFGSQAFYQPTLFLEIASSAARLGLELIISAGDLVGDDGFRADLAKRHPTASVFRLAPQQAILPLVDVVITHGGANTIVESVWHGRPVVVIPLCNDQFLQARFVTRAGVGVVVPADATASTLTTALVAARAPPIRETMSAAAQQYRQKNGPEAAAAHIVCALEAR